MIKPVSDLRVAMLLQSYRPVLGGAQRQVEDLVPLLARKGIESRVITRRAPGYPAREVTPGAIVERVRVPQFKGGASVVYTAAAVAHTLRFRPDVVHGIDLHSPSLAALIASVPLRIPIVATVLSTGIGGDIDRLHHKPLGAQRLKLLAHRVAAFHTLSEDVEGELLAAGVAPERFVRIANGVDTSVFRPATQSERAAARAQLGVPAEGNVAFYCGRFAPVKRLNVLLEDFAKVEGHLLLLGDGSEAEQLREQAQDPRLHGRVTFHPPLDDTSVGFRAADVYVSSSLTEGMSVSMLEAMSSGVTILAAPASGVHDLFADGGGVVASGDFGEQLTELFGDPGRREQIGARARELVERLYSMEETARAFAELYRRLGS